MSPPAFERTLAERFPWIAWREPIKVSTPAGLLHLACRICIARRGLKASEIEGLPATPAEFESHMRENHTDG